MKTLIKSLLITGLFIIMVTPFSRAYADDVIVIKTDADLEARYQQMVDTFQNQGTDAVVENIEGSLGDEETLHRWQDLVNSTEVKVVDVVVHPNEAKAVEWMNLRFERMGIPNLKFNAIKDKSERDQTDLPDEKIKGRKWLRYLAGPGIAAVATYLALPPGQDLATMDYIYVVIPGAAVGVTTIALELQFAWPWLNKNFWSKVWNFGGAVGGRVANITTNFMYGMALWGSGVLGSQFSDSMGVTTGFPSIDFSTAVVAALFGGVTFHIAMGQYQTDIKVEENRGSISGPGRYGRETAGVVINNSARVFDWIMPGPWGTYAQSSFFLLKTLPQIIKTHLAHRIQDLNIREKIDPENKLRAGEKASIFQKVGRGAVKCARFFSQLPLINLPKQRRD